MRESYKQLKKEAYHPDPEVVYLHPSLFHKFDPVTSCTLMRLVSYQFQHSTIERKKHGWFAIPNGLLRMEPQRQNETLNNLWTSGFLTRTHKGMVWINFDLLTQTISEYEKKYEKRLSDGWQDLLEMKIKTSVECYEQTGELPSEEERDEGIQLLIDDGSVIVEKEPDGTQWAKPGNRIGVFSTN